MSTSEKFVQAALKTEDDELETGLIWFRKLVVAQISQMRRVVLGEIWTYRHSRLK